MKRRILSFALAFLFLFSLVFSVTLIGTQATHEHIGENDCLICAQLHDCAENLISAQTCLSGEKASLRRLFARGIFKTLPCCKRRERRFTPVSLKDKLIS